MIELLIGLEGEGIKFYVSSKLSSSEDALSILRRCIIENNKIEYGIGTV